MVIKNEQREGREGRKRRGRSKSGQGTNLVREWVGQGSRRTKGGLVCLDLGKG